MQCNEIHYGWMILLHNRIHTQTNNFEKTDPLYCICSMHAGYVNTHIRKLIATPGAYACCFFSPQCQMFSIWTILWAVLLSTGYFWRLTKICCFFFVYFGNALLMHMQSKWTIFRPFFSLMKIIWKTRIIISKTCENLLLIRFHLIVCIWSQ